MLQKHKENFIEKRQLQSQYDSVGMSHIAAHVSQFCYFANFLLIMSNKQENKIVKRLCTPLNVLLHGFWKYLSLSMHLLPRMDVMLHFIWTLQAQLRGTRNKWTLKTFLFTVELEPPKSHPLLSSVSPLTTRLSGLLTKCD